MKCRKKYKNKKPKSCKSKIGGIMLVYKINEIINKFLLAGDKSMPEMHLRQPRFTYCSCKRFTKNKERTQTFKEKGDSRYIYQSKPDDVCFKHDTAHGDLTDLPGRAVSDKV